MNKCFKIVILIFVVGPLYAGDHEGGLSCDTTPFPAPSAQENVPFGLRSPRPSLTPRKVTLDEGDGLRPQWDFAVLRRKTCSPNVTLRDKRVLEALAAMGHSDFFKTMAVQRLVGMTSTWILQKCVQRLINSRAIAQIDKTERIEFTQTCMGMVRECILTGLHVSAISIDAYKASLAEHADKLGIWPDKVGECVTQKVKTAWSMSPLVVIPLAYQTWKFFKLNRDQRKYYESRRVDALEKALEDYRYACAGERAELRSSSAKKQAALEVYNQLARSYPQIVKKYELPTQC